MTDKAVAREIGARFKRLRLRKNVRQSVLAERCGLARSTVVSLEAGQAKLTTMIAVLRELGALDELDSFLPDPAVSPLELARRKGAPRRRARPKLPGQGRGDDGPW